MDALASPREIIGVEIRVFVPAHFDLQFLAKDRAFPVAEKAIQRRQLVLEQVQIDSHPVVALASVIGIERTRCPAFEPLNERTMSPRAMLRSALFQYW
jgi:hypothetical protein